MDFNIETRLNQIQSLDNFISYSRNKVQSILDCLQWNVADTSKETSLVRCSVDPKHRVSSATVNKHIPKCILKNEGYDVDEMFLSEHVNSISSIYIDNLTKIKILTNARQTIPNFRPAWNGKDTDPKTSNRLLTTFSPDERLALYEYAVKNTTGVPELPEFNIFLPTNNETTALTEEEMLRKERDAKRRRIKYKSVHTNRKNYTEIMREVINGQMELYSEWVDGNIRMEKNNSPDNLSGRDSYHYADSDTKHNAHSGRSTAKYNGNTFVKRRNSDSSRNSRDRSYRNRRSPSRDRKNVYHNQERTDNSHKRRRSRSRSSGRHENRRRYRSRSRSKQKRYSRNRR